MCTITNQTSSRNAVITTFLKFVLLPHFFFFVRHTEKKLTLQAPIALGISVCFHLSRSFRVISSNFA